MSSLPDGIPFSTPDEARGTEPIDIAQKRVREWIAEFLPLHEDYTTYVVMFSYILGNWKALVSTSLPDGRYYEVTRDARKGVEYVDVYIKQDNHVRISSVYNSSVYN